MLSVIAPVYKNEANIAALLEAGTRFAASLDDACEFVFVVDKSPDRSFDVLRDALRDAPFASQLILLSKNEGSFTAIRAGLAQASGTHFTMLAADLQEPMTLLQEMFTILRTRSCDVVIAERNSREDGWFSNFTSKAFWSAFHVGVMASMPTGGFDTFLCTRAFRDQLLNLRESHSSLVAQILWLGGRRASIPYDRQRRRVGRSAWTLRKKLRYLSDSVFSFTDLPIRVLTAGGGLGVLGSCVWGGLALYGSAFGASAVRTTTLLALLICFFGSLTVYAIGIVGSYVWRAYENTKGRPLYHIQEHLVYRPGLAAAVK